jgi:hypothetical protein
MAAKNINATTQRIHSHNFRFRGAQLWIGALAFIFCIFSPRALIAQTAGGGNIQGTVTDQIGAVVPNVTVTATNVATGVETSRPTSEDGLFNIAPLIPGTYTVTATAKGFETFKQENMDVQAMHNTGLNISLKIGSESTQVTVSTAPPQLDTTNATLGGTIESNEYMALPLLVSGNQQRDVTQFSNLLPGAQLNPGGRSSVIGGTAERIGEEYLNGIPITTISQEGDNRPIFNVVPLESISEVQVVTSGFSAEYQGIGLENYTMKSGEDRYHGTAADFIRNTFFDTWGFAAPWSTITNARGVSGFQRDVGSKPVDHQNEFSGSFGGPLIIPHFFNGRKNLFFEGTYDRTHTRSAPTFSFDTLPTALMQTGNFSQLLAANGGPGLAIYDPTTQAACTAKSTTGPCRYQFGYGQSGTVGPNGNPGLTGAPVNVIPAGEISPISQYLQKFLPTLTNANITSNYLGGIPSGYDSYLWGGRIDYVISPRQRLSLSAADGRRHAVPYTAGEANLPVPYLAATLSTVVGDLVDLEHTFTITPNLVNDVSLGYFYFGGPPTQNNTEGMAQYEATTAGISGLPTGQASDEFPGVSFAGTEAGTAWSQPDVSSKTVSHTFDIVDNVNWVHGNHSMTFGIQLQDLMENASNFNSSSSPITYAFSSNDTSDIAQTSTPGVYQYATTTGGFAYASYMLGAVDSTGVTLQPFADVGSRYHTIAPYFQDDYKLTKKITLNLGLRWDYLPPFHEARDHWSFLNANLTNPYTGNPGSFEFAGNFGGPSASCGCTTPVNTYWKNWGPRLGFAYAAHAKTVLRGGFAILYSHDGGTGGAGATGTGQTGFTTSASFPANAAGPSAAPAFYLNNNASFPLSNTNLGGPGYSLPSIPAPSATTQLSDGLVGNFVNSAGAFVKSTNGIAYADPIFGDRTPTVYFYNLGIQQSLSPNITLTMNYAGTMSHFIAGASNIRGPQSSEINPKYFPLGTLLTAPATPANVAAAEAIMPGCCTAPYPGFTAAAETAAGATFATIGQGLKLMPQYSGVTDTWGSESANAAYNSLQASLAIRPTHGLTFNVNYTWSKEMDDAGTIRTGFAVPGAENATGQFKPAHSMDWSLSTLDQPQSIAAYGVYDLPFGKGNIGSNHFLVRVLAGGWKFSNILTYSSGYPLTLTSSACTATDQPGQGECMPDVNPNFRGKILSTPWKQGVTALNLGTQTHINNGYVSNTTLGDGVTSTGAGAPCGSSAGPFCNVGAFMIGDAPRTGAFGLRSPGGFRLTSGLRRSFDITERVKFVFGVDVQNVTNSVTFGSDAGNLEIPTNVNSSNFGTLDFASSDSRDFQFSGRIAF